ncbi:MAG: cache domain-containing protein, partial [Oscillospiraceae bacterium]
MIVLIIVSVFTFTLSISMNVSSIKDSLKITMQNGNSRIESWFFQKEQMLNTVADSISLYSKDDIQGISSALAVHNGKYDFLVDTYIGTDDNKMYCGSGWTPDADYVVTDRDWYVGVPTDGTIKYTSTYIDADSGLLVITISRSVQDKSGNNFGVIAMDITLSSLVELANNEKILDTDGKAFLLDNNFNIIAHNDKTIIPAIVNGAEKYTNMKDLELNPDCFNLDSENPLRVSKGTNGKIVFFGLSTITNNGWSYGFEVPIYNFNSTYIMLFVKWMIILAIMTVFSTYTTKKTVRKLLLPINTLIDKTRQISSGDTDIEFDIHTNDELEELS